MIPAHAKSEAKKSGLAYWASRVLEECDKASNGFAADPVHDLRVAIRRCRSMADGFLSVDPDPAWKQMKRLAKPLFAALGDLRDTQVMLEWVAKLRELSDPLGDELLAALAAKEHHLKSAAQHALSDFDCKHWVALNGHLANRTGNVPLEGLVFQHLALERWMDARELHRRALRNRSGAAWHQLRIGIKRFRYTVENFLPQRHEKWAKDLRELQDALGEVHDFDVLRTLISAHPVAHDAERSRWFHRIAEERQRRLEVYRSKMVGRATLWDVWRAELPTGNVLEEAGIEKLRTWASLLDPDAPHSRLVTELALTLFDGLSHCGILHPGLRDRLILEAAAYLHEVGRGKQLHRQPGGHQKRGQRTVAKLKPPIGWSAEDMQCLAALVRFHRGRLPARNEAALAGLDRKRRTGLLRMMGVLRLANALDESHRGSVSRLAITREGNTVVVGVEGLRAMSQDAEHAARARYLLETVCRRPILIRMLRNRSRVKSLGPRVNTGRTQPLNL